MYNMHNTYKYKELGTFSKNLKKVRPSLDGVRALILGGEYFVRIFNEDKSKRKKEEMDNSLLDIIKH